MTASESLSPVASSRRKPIKVTTRNDVLLGRGPALSKFEGNLRFRNLVDDRKEQYVTAQKRKEKGDIANEILGIIQSAGGRFLKLDETVDFVEDVYYEVSNDVSLEKTKQALREHREPVSGNKCNEVGRSQEQSCDMEAYAFSPSLTFSVNLACGMKIAPETDLSQDTLPLMERQMRDVNIISVPPSSSQSIKGNNNGRSPPMEGPLSTVGSVCMAGGFPVAIAATPPSHEPVTSAPSAATFKPMPAHNSVPSILDPRLLLFQNVGAVPDSQNMLAQSLLMNELLHSQLENSIQSRRGTTIPPLVNVDQETLTLQNLFISTSVTAAASHQRYLADNAICSLLRNFDLMKTSNTRPECGPGTVEAKVARLKSATKANVEEVKESSVPLVEIPPSYKSGLADESIDEEISSFILSSLAVSDRPVITEEQEEVERASFTNAEKAAVIADMFGKMCEYDTHQKKRPRLDLDRTFVEFLLRQMRTEIDKIPWANKLAFLEAQASKKCHRDEFSDARLEKFLRCESMNVKLAAQRFVNYWECRREVFGPEKYVQSMSLSGALRDDLLALEAGVYTILPHPDVSGRQILYMEPRCHTREGYSSESLLRAFWYISEVAAQQNNDISGGIVNIVWFKGSTIWDYDNVFDKWAFFMSSCWPIRLISNHLCCAPYMILQLAKPIIHSFVDKSFRARTWAHPGAESEILDTLWIYGIQKEMLPSQMGGTIELDPSDWIANRRAAEIF